VYAPLLGRFAAMTVPAARLVEEPERRTRVMVEDVVGVQARARVDAPAERVG